MSNLNTLLTFGVCQFLIINWLRNTFCPMLGITKLSWYKKNEKPVWRAVNVIFSLIVIVLAGGPTVGWMASKSGLPGAAAMSWLLVFLAVSLSTRYINKFLLKPFEALMNYLEARLTHYAKMYRIKD